MTFKFVESLAAGNAVRFVVRPPSDVTSFRLLRRTTGSFTGHDDAGAVVVADRPIEDWERRNLTVVDRFGLANGTPYNYRIYYDADNARYEDTAATPAADYQDGSQDVLALLMERLRLGLVVEVGRGTLLPKTGSVGVQNAPPLWDATPLPVVTIHLANAAMEDRGLGEILGPDVETETEYFDGEGSLARVSITVVGWSLNPDERIVLRRAIRRILNANLPVFEDAGMALVDWSQRDQEDMQSYNVPVYQVVTEFSCLVPEWIESSAGKVDDVISVANIDGDLV